MSQRNEGVDFMGPGRARILEALRVAGPTPVAELPRRWPLTRTHVRAVVAAMEASGVVVRRPGPAGGVVALPSRGFRRAA